jgi:hypothetical protein
MLLQTRWNYGCFADCMDLKKGKDALCRMCQVRHEVSLNEGMPTYVNS